MTKSSFGPTRDPDTGATYSRDPRTGMGPTSQPGTPMPPANSAADNRMNTASIGWLTGPAAESNPRRTSPHVPIGPGTAIWNSKKSAKTLGDQRKPR